MTEMIKLNQESEIDSIFEPGKQIGNKINEINDIIRSIDNKKYKYDDASASNKYNIQKYLRIHNSFFEIDSVTSDVYYENAFPPSSTPTNKFGAMCNSIMTLYNQCCGYIATDIDNQIAKMLSNSKHKQIIEDSSLASASISANLQDVTSTKTELENIKTEIDKVNTFVAKSAGAKIHFTADVFDDINTSTKINLANLIRNIGDIKTKLDGCIAEINKKIAEMKTFIDDSNIKSMHDIVKKITNTTPNPYINKYKEFLTEYYSLITHINDSFGKYYTDDIDSRPFDDIAYYEKNIASYTSCANNSIYTKIKSYVKEYHVKDKTLATIKVPKNVNEMIDNIDLQINFVNDINNGIHSIYNSLMLIKTAAAYTSDDIKKYDDLTNECDRAIIWIEEKYTDDLDVSTISKSTSPIGLDSTVIDIFTKIKNLITDTSTKSTFKIKIAALKSHHIVTVHGLKTLDIISKSHIDQYAIGTKITSPPNIVIGNFISHFKVAQNAIKEKILSTMKLGTINILSKLNIDQHVIYDGQSPEIKVGTFGSKYAVVQKIIKEKSTKPPEIKIGTFNSKYAVVQKTIKENPMPPEIKVGTFSSKYAVVQKVIKEKSATPPEIKIGTFGSKYAVVQKAIKEKSTTPPEIKVGTFISKYAVAQKAIKEKPILPEIKVGTFISKYAVAQKAIKEKPTPTPSTGLVKVTVLSKLNIDQYVIYDGKAPEIKVGAFSSKYIVEQKAIKEKSQQPEIKVGTFNSKYAVEQNAIKSPPPKINVGTFNSRYAVEQKVITEKLAAPKLTPTPTGLPQITITSKLNVEQNVICDKIQKSTPLPPPAPEIKVGIFSSKYAVVQQEIKEKPINKNPDNDDDDDSSSNSNSGSNSSSSKGKGKGTDQNTNKDSNCTDSEEECKNKKALYDKLVGGDYIDATSIKDQIDDVICEYFNSGYVYDAMKANNNNLFKIDDKQFHESFKNCISCHNDINSYFIDKVKNESDLYIICATILVLGITLFKNEPLYEDTYNSFLIMYRIASLYNNDKATREKFEKMFDILKYIKINDYIVSDNNDNTVNTFLKMYVSEKDEFGKEGISVSINNITEKNRNFVLYLAVVISIVNPITQNTKANDCDLKTTHITITNSANKKTLETKIEEIYKTANTARHQQQQDQQNSPK